MSADGVLGGDICQLGLQPDYIDFTCMVRYKGNIAPTLTWIQDGEDSLTRVTTSVGDTENHSLLTSTAVVQANERMNGSSFTCFTNMIWNKNTALEELQEIHITWTSPVIYLLCMYLFVSRKNYQYITGNFN